MRKFRKKPVVVTAQQWFPGTDVAGVVEGKIITLEGALTVSPGDWIITGVQNEKYPCKPDIFAETYEEVAD